MCIRDRLLSGQKFSSTLIGDSSLSLRPMKRILEPLKEMGAFIFAKDNTAPLSIKVSKKLSGISYELPIASAQVKSCILLAGLYADSNTQVIENYLTRDHTEKMFKKFGIEIDENFKNSKKIIKISPPQRLNPSNINVPGDFSSASFFIVAGLIIPNSEIILKNVGINPSRTALLKVLIEMGANIRIKNIKDDYEKTADI